MYALRERRVHVTQEDFELAVAKVSGGGRAIFFAANIFPSSAPPQIMQKDSEKNMSLKKFFT